MILSMCSCTRIPVSLLSDYGSIKSMSMMICAEVNLHVCPFIHIPGASHWLRFIELYNSTPKRLPVSHWLRFVVVYIGEYFSSPIRCVFISYAQYHSRTLNFSKINFVQIYITVLIILVSILSKRANIYIGRIQDIIPSDIIPLTSRILRL
jgi:hypothetical protein